jgi:hypothetical protein
MFRPPYARPNWHYGMPKLGIGIERMIYAKKFPIPMVLGFTPTCIVKRVT